MWAMWSATPSQPACAPILSKSLCRQSGQGEDLADTADGAQCVELRFQARLLEDGVFQQVDLGVQTLHDRQVALQN